MRSRTAGASYSPARDRTSAFFPSLRKSNRLARVRGGGAAAPPRAAKPGRGDGAKARADPAPRARKSATARRVERRVGAVMANSGFCYFGKRQFAEAKIHTSLSFRRIRLNVATLVPNTVRK